MSAHDVDYHEPRYLPKRERSQITGETMTPVLYLDLDGTVRWGKDELGHFVNEPKDVRVFDEVPGHLLAYKTAGWRIIAVTNQGGVALGHMTPETSMLILKETQRQCLGAFDWMMVCHHYPGEGVIPEMATCWCRKPRPGMIIEGALELAIRTGEIYPPHLALMVGDRPEDEQCAENAGVRFMGAEDWRKGLHLEELARV